MKGINDGEVERIVAARPFHSLTDFWHRARVSRPVVERLVLAGGFDAIYGIDLVEGVHRRSRVTRRDLLLQVAELDRHARAIERAGGRSLASRGLASRSLRSGSRAGSVARATADDAAARNSTDPRVRESVAELERHPLGDAGVWARAAAQSKATPAPPPVDSVQLTLELGDAPAEGEVSGLPEMTPEERMKAELEILGLDASRHVVDSYAAFLDELGVTRSRDLLARRSKSELLVAGVKVATQTPPIRSGRRVIFLTLDDVDRPGRRDVLRGRAGPLRRHRLPLLAAGGAWRAAPHRLQGRLAARHRLLGAAGAGARSGSAPASRRCAR